MTDRIQAARQAYAEYKSALCNQAEALPQDVLVAFILQTYSRHLRALGFYPSADWGQAVQTPTAETISRLPLDSTALTRLERILVQHGIEIQEAAELGAVWSGMWGLGEPGP